MAVSVPTTAATASTPTAIATRRAASACRVIEPAVRAGRAAAACEFGTSEPGAPGSDWRIGPAAGPRPDPQHPAHPSDQEEAGDHGNRQGIDRDSAEQREQHQRDRGKYQGERPPAGHRHRPSQGCADDSDHQRRHQQRAGHAGRHGDREQLAPTAEQTTHHGPHALDRWQHTERLLRSGATNSDPIGIASKQCR